MASFDTAAIGARIRLARIEKGLAQEDLAARASFSLKSLQNYETGKTLQIRKLRELSQLLNRPIRWFLYGDEEEISGPGGDRLQAMERELAKVQQSLAGLADLLASLDRIDNLAASIARLEALLHERGDPSRSGPVEA